MDPVDANELLHLAHEMEKPLERWLKFRQVVNRFDRGKKAKLAEIILRLDKLCVGQKHSMAKMETMAYGEPEWREYLEDWSKAEQEMIKAQVLVDTLRNKFDALQSVLAYNREHMKRFGG